jgi:hypothetical protein
MMLRYLVCLIAENENEVPLTSLQEIKRIAPLLTVWEIYLFMLFAPVGLLIDLYIESPVLSISNPFIKIDNRRPPAQP